MAAARGWHHLHHPHLHSHQPDSVPTLWETGSVAPGPVRAAFSRTELWTGTQQRSGGDGAPGQQRSLGGAELRLSSRRGAGAARARDVFTGKIPERKVRPGRSHPVLGPAQVVPGESDR